MANKRRSNEILVGDSLRSYAQFENRIRARECGLVYDSEADDFYSQSIITESKYSGYEPGYYDYN